MFGIHKLCEFSISQRNFLPLIRGNFNFDFYSEIYHNLWVSKHYSTNEKAEEKFNQYFNCDQ